MQRIFSGQVIFALILVLLNTIYASQLVQMDRPFATGQPGPAFLPWMLCIFVYVAMAIILIGEFRGEGDAPAPPPQSAVIPHLSVTGPLFLIALTAAFIVGFVYAGYAVSAAIYIFLIALFFNIEEGASWPRAAAIAAATSAIVTAFGWLFFVRLFDLFLPGWSF